MGMNDVRRAPTEGACIYAMKLLYSLYSNLVNLSYNKVIMRNSQASTMNPDNIEANCKSVFDAATATLAG